MSYFKTGRTIRSLPVDIGTCVTASSGVPKNPSRPVHRLISLAVFGTVVLSISRMTSVAPVDSSAIATSRIVAVGVEAVNLVVISLLLIKRAVLLDHVT